MTVELWQPRAFVVGERVRVRLSPECRRAVRRHSMLGRMGRSHDDLFDGEVGTVDEISDRHGDHPYGVVFDRGGRYGYRAEHFAAVEIEPLDEDALAAAPRPRGEGG